MKMSGAWVTGVAISVVLLAGAVLIMWSNQARVWSAPRPLASSVSPEVNRSATGSAGVAGAGFLKSGEFDTGLAAVRALAIGPDGLVAATGEGMLVVVETNGTLVKAWAVPKDTRCLAYTQQGIWAGIGDHVVRWAVGGELLEQSPAFASNAVVTSLAVIDDRLVVSDAGARLMYACDATGHVEGVTGSRFPTNGVEPETEALGLGTDPARVAVDAAGHVLVAVPPSGKVIVYERIGRR